MTERARKRARVAWNGQRRPRLEASGCVLEIEASENRQRFMSGPYGRRAARVNAVASARTPLATAGVHD